ncbi:secretin N-terminal domain-containing protein [Deinococcus aluminii]|uniref:Type IV piliation system protein DR_0774 n=1 Tax=Deinococcus aluminii TaxID=1656885 RepID=A0ABP9XD57_9DEIO
MKRYALLLTAALGMAAAQTTPIPATPAPGTRAGTATPPSTTRIAADPQLTGANVTFDLRRAGSDLATMLLALAKSAGYDIILEPDVDAVLQAGSVTSGNAGGPGANTNNSGPTAAQVTYNFVNKPFNEVWPLVLDIYGLSYETLRIGDKPVLRVSAKPVQKIVPLPKTLDAALVERQLRLSFGSVKTVSNSQSNANGDQGAHTNTTETTRGDIVLDSPTMRIVAEPTSNSIIIRGTNQEVAQVERLLSDIVAVQPRALLVASQENVQRIYTVKGQQADVTALLGAQYPGLKVTPIGQTGQLIVSGPQNQLDAALTLLGQVDRPAPPVATGQSIYTVKGQQADVTTLLGAQYPGLKVTPVGQTGQLIVSGPQNQLDAALTLLAQVDRPAPAPQAGPQTVQRVFQLVNASAEEVKATLEGTLARDLTPPALVPNATVIDPTTGQPYTTGPLANAPLNASTPATSAPASGTAGSTPGNGTSTSNTATIIADKRTNTLIVRGTTEQVTQIAELIPQLDQVVPQINVQVRIQEINETAARTLGMDWKVNFGGFNISVGGGGLGAAFDPTRSLMGFNIFPTLQALENQGLTKRVYDGNITMQSGQRSLGSNTSTQNASSTAAASIKSGGRLEINIPSQAANVPPIQKQIDYGVNLDFFDPQVAPDGTVTLRVRGQVNQPDTLPTTGLPTLLNFSNSEAQSSITFKSGQTVLMSGLLGTNETRTTAGVPFLSSLPVIGAAFSKQTTTRTQTQLLVIITGTVVK